MRTSAELGQFIRDQELSPEQRGTPRESVDAALRRLENVAYTKGVEAALSRIEILAAIIPSRISAKEIIRMIGVERDTIVAEWKAKICPR